MYCYLNTYTKAYCTTCEYYYVYIIYLRILSIFIIRVAAIAVGVVDGSTGLAIGALATYTIAVLIAVLCCSSCEGRSEIEMLSRICKLHFASNLLYRIHRVLPCLLLSVLLWRFVTHINHSISAQDLEQFHFIISTNVQIAF